MQRSGPRRRLFLGSHLGGRPTTSSPLRPPPSSSASTPLRCRRAPSSETGARAHAVLREHPPHTAKPVVTPCTSDVCRKTSNGIPCVSRHWERSSLPHLRRLGGSRYSPRQRCWSGSWVRSRHGTSPECAPRRQPCRRQRGALVLVLALALAHAPRRPVAPSPMAPCRSSTRPYFLPLSPLFLSFSL